MANQSSYIYIMANNRPTLYIGVTSDLLSRVYEHKQSLIAGFTSTYQVHKLVYYEEFSSIEHAIRREKLLKKWKREWKLDLIHGFNPTMKDLYNDLIDPRVKPEDDVEGNSVKPEDDVEGNSVKPEDDVG